MSMYFKLSWKKEEWVKSYFYCILKSKASNAYSDFSYTFEHFILENIHKYNFVAMQSQDIFSVNFSNGWNLFIGLILLAGLLI